MSQRVITRYFEQDPVAEQADVTLEGLNYSTGRSAIDKLGLGPDIVRLKKAGLSQQEIAIQLSLSRDQVQHWLASYKEKSEEQRVSIHKKSVFDISERLQEVFTDLHTLLSDIKGDNRELEVKVLDKMLKAIDHAANLIERVEMVKNNERFKEVILDLLDQEAPGIKAKALKRLGEFKEGHATLRPL